MGCPVESLIKYGMLTEPNKLHNLTEDMDNWTYVVGYCNGLVCLACFDGSVFPWNPSTRKSTRLPKYERGAHTVFGFAYDELNEDFKVFTIIGDSENKVSVYSSNSGWWRIIGDFPLGKLSRMCRGQFAYGALHWLFSQEDVHKEIIVSLDINTETHQEVLQPNFGKDVYNLTLGTLGNSLSVLSQYISGADIWVMKEHGVEESWTKLFTFPIPEDLPYIPRIRPTCMLENGDFMMLLDLSVILTNSENKFMMPFDTWRNHSYNMFQDFNVYTYVESLVSPPNLNSVGSLVSPQI